MKLKTNNSFKTSYGLTLPISFRTFRSDATVKIREAAKQNLLTRSHSSNTQNYLGSLVIVFSRLFKAAGKITLQSKLLSMDFAKFSFPA